jgi:hypothetical protein
MDFFGGLARMHSEQPEMFWSFIYTIAPGFIVMMPFGMLEQSRFMNGRRSSSPFWLIAIAADMATVALTCYKSEWFPIDDPLSLAVGLILAAMLYAFPVLGGAQSGAYIWSAFCFVYRVWHRIRSQAT